MPFQRFSETAFFGERMVFVYDILGKRKGASKRLQVQDSLYKVEKHSCIGKIARLLGKGDADQRKKIICGVFGYAPAYSEPFSKGGKERILL